MNAVKILLGAVLIATIYFAFFASDLPGEIQFRGQDLGPKESVENDTLKNFDIYSYRDKSNHHLLLFVMAVDDTATAQQLLDVYARTFEAQGFKIMNQDNRHLGRRGDEVLYLAKATPIDSAVAYIEKAPATFPSGLQDADAVFSSLEGFSF